MKKYLIIMFFIMTLYLDSRGIKSQDLIVILNKIDNIICNVDSLQFYMSDTNYVKKSFIATYKKYRLGLASHIINNKFKEGYEIYNLKFFEGLNFKNESFTGIDVILKSTLTGEILLFILTNREYQWRISDYSFCINYGETRPDNDVPCKKK